MSLFTSTLVFLCVCQYIVCICVRKPSLTIDVHSIIPPLLRQYANDDTPKTIVLHNGYEIHRGYFVFFYVLTCRRHFFLLRKLSCTRYNVRQCIGFRRKTDIVYLARTPRLFSLSRSRTWLIFRT